MSSILENEAKSILQKQIKKENRQVLRVISAMFLCGLIAALIYALVNKESANYVYYLGVNCVLVLITMLAVDFKWNVVDTYGDNAICFVEGLIYLSSIIGGTIMCEHPSEIVTFAVMLVFVPGLFYERIFTKILLSSIAMMIFVALDYIYKPFDVFMCEVPHILVLGIIGIVSSSLLMKTRISNLRGKIIEEEYNNFLKTENKTITDKYMYSVEDLLKDRDESTGDHVKRTGDVVEFIVNAIKSDNTIGADSDILDDIVKAAPLHDIGKMAIDDTILKKKGKLTEEEYCQIKEHTERGAAIIRRMFSGMKDEELATVTENIAHFHHERYDGEGYPMGLKKDQIPLEARIMAIADVFDALVSKRCYKGSMSFDEAFNLIEKGMGSQFDPELNKYFLACRPKLEKYYA